MIEATGAQIITALLERQDVKCIAGIPGGSVLPLYDALASSNLRHILVRHEQAGGFFAQGYARSTGMPAVCIATSGPGAMNLLTAIADARADSVPLVVITGQVATNFIGTDAFQEADTFGLSFPITKHSMMITDAKELLEAIPKAFRLAASGRPGPVLIDVPVDVQNQKVRFESWPEPGRRERRAARYRTEGAELASRLRVFTETLVHAKHPVLFAGGGCNSSWSAAALKDFLDVFPMPVVTSLMGLCAIPHEHPCYAGMTGMYGSPSANELLRTADVVLAAGVRFDERAAGKRGAFLADAKLLHIDIDAAEVDKLLPAYCSIVADTESIFPCLTQYFKQCLIKGSKDDMARLAEERRESMTDGAKLIEALASCADRAGWPSEKMLVTADVGLHQMWTANGFPFKYPRQFLASGSLGTMGFGLPAAIGAAVAHPEKRVLCVSGDGSILMNVQELATLVEMNADVTVFVCDNSSLGMVRQQQKGHRSYATSYEAGSNIALIAEGFGIPARSISEEAVLAGTGDWIEFAFPPSGSGPRLIRCIVKRDMQ